MPPVASKPKRKHIDRSIQDKLDILEEFFASGVSQREICRKYDISPQTFSGWKAKQKEWQELKGSGRITTAKRKKESKNVAVERALILWFYEIRNRPNPPPLSRQMLVDKATFFAKELGLDWQGNSGFIDRWRKAYKITNKSICGSKDAGADEKSIQEYIAEELIPKLAQYAPKNIYNADETALYYKGMPYKTYAMPGEKPRGGRKHKDRVTLLQIVNMDASDKRKLVMIGKAEKPQCFEKYKIKREQLPVDYYATPSAWMNRATFDKILTKWNRELRAQNRKILLVCDNASCHQCGQYSNIEVFFLLPNATATIQPLDQGIILSTKRRYKKRIAERYLLTVDNGKCGQQMLRRFDLVQAINMIAAAWKEVSVEIIQNCFRKASFKHHAVSPELAPEEAPIEPSPAVWQRIQQAVGEDVLFDEYVNAERYAERTEAATDAEIIERVRTENQPAPEKDDEDEDDSDTDDEDDMKYAVKSTTQCLSMLEQIKMYMKRNDIPVNLVESVEDLITNVHVKVCTKQVSVTGFFQKNTPSGRPSTPDTPSTPSGRPSTPDTPSTPSGRPSTPDTPSTPSSSAVFTGTPVRSTPTRLRGRPGFTQFSPSTQLSLTPSGRSSTPDSPSTSGQSNSEFTSTPVTSTPCSMRGRLGLTHLSLTPISSTPVSPATSGSLFSPASTTLTDSLNIYENLSVDTSAASLAAAQLMQDTPAVSTKRRLIPEVDERPAKKMYKTHAAVEKLMNMTSDVSSMDSDNESVFSIRL